MRVRFSTCIGLVVVEELMEEPVATISGILIDPDMATIEGFFVRVPRFLHSEELFLSTMDITHWGSRIRIRNIDVIAPLDERVRLQALVDDGRTVIGQKMLTEQGMVLGTCRDVQFETHLFNVEWLFPKKFFRWQRAIPTSAVLRVQNDGIIVRDVLVPPVEAESASATILEQLDPLAQTPVPRVAELKMKN